MKIFIALALLAVQANGQGGFFPTLTALTALNASKVGLPVNGAEENTKPYNLPAGYTQKKIVDRRTLLATGTFPTTFSTFDMITFAAPEGATVGAYPNAGQYIFIPPEVGAGGGVGRYNVVDGTFVPLLVGNGSRIRVANPANWTATNGDYTSTDPTTFTPWGTLLVAEETTGMSSFICFLTNVSGCSSFVSPWAGSSLSWVLTPRSRRFLPLIGNRRTHVRSPKSLRGYDCGGECPLVDLHPRRQPRRHSLRQCR